MRKTWCSLRGLTRSYAHPAIDKTEQLFRPWFKVLDARYNPVSVSDACHSLVLSCAVCQQTKPRRGRQPDKLDFTPVPEHIIHSVSVDCVELPDYPAKNGIVYDYALCVVCRLTGYVVAILCVKKGLTSSDVAQMFVERVFVHFGLPAAIYPDWDKLINAEFCKQGFKLTDIGEYKSPV